MKMAIGDFREFGPRVDGGGIIFTFSVSPAAKKVSLILYNIKDKKRIEEIKLNKSYSVGSVYSVKVFDISPDDICYLINVNGEKQMDPYCTAVVGRDTWGDSKGRANNKFRVYSGIARIDKSWNDEEVDIAPSDMVLYKLHMRGFTFGTGLGSTKCGNYKGLVSKLSYLKKFGVTSIELMPSYDFEDLVLENKQNISSTGLRTQVQEFTGKINYWGYGDAFYFAPKAAYFGGSLKACAGFRDMIKAIHSNNMECILEMSFSQETESNTIIDCLVFYVRYYHVDGFHIIGCNGPIEAIAKCPYLSDTKIFYEYIKEEILCNEKGKKHLFLYNDSFMDVTRQIQNHMNGSMVQFANHMRRQNAAYGFVNYMASVCGFSLFDSYSYGEKHNQANGEENRDGTNANFSFNYGVEGKTNLKTINSLRFLAMRNAFAALILSQSVPLIVAGDEVAATHEGNNNPYCQDNKTGYTVFTKTKNKLLLQKFVKELLKFRKSHKCIRPEASFSMSDYRHLGIPDMSFHGSEPWMMYIGEEQKALGVLFNGAYADEKEDVYVCYNFHYDTVSMALPLLSPHKRWRKIFNTLEFDEDSDFTPKPIHDQQAIDVPGNSITLLVGMKP